jgi:hypothetical protein
MDVPELRAASSLNHFNHAAATRLAIRTHRTCSKPAFTQAALFVNSCEQGPGHALSFVLKKPINPAISATLSIIEKLTNCNKIVIHGRSRSARKSFHGNR